MHHEDPAGLLPLDLPAGWAVDPASSTLFQRVFTQWSAAEPRGLFVGLEPAATGGTDHDWVARIRAGLPPEARSVEVGAHPAPVVWVVRPGRDGRSDQRWAIVRGRRADVVLEEVGVPLGGPVRTPTLLSVVTGLDVPLNRGDGWTRPDGTWDALMDAADAAGARGDLGARVERLAAAHVWAIGAWLASVQDGAPVSRDLIAAGQTRLSLASSTSDPAELALTVELALRLTPFADDEPEGLQAFTERLLALCGEATGAPVTSLWHAYPESVGLLVRDVLDDRGATRDRAETTMRLAASSYVVTQRLRAGTPDAQAAIDAFRRRCVAQVAAAGAAYQRALWHDAEVFPADVAAEWLGATRLLVAADPHDEAVTAMHVAALLAAAGSCTRVGDPESVRRAEQWLDGARLVVADRPEHPLHDQVWLLSAWTSVAGGRPDEALERAGRMAARTPDLARSRHAVEATALRLAGRHDEELVHAREAVSDADPSDSTHRLVLAQALASTGYADQATAEAVRALRSGLAESPLGAPVARALVVLAEMHRETDPPLSLRLTVLVEALLELQSSLLVHAAEAVGFSEVAHHRAVVADLVVRLVDADRLGEALVVAEYARAGTSRLGSAVAGDRPGPPWPGEDTARLGEVADALEGHLAHVRSTRGLPPRLSAAALVGLVAESGRPTLVLHPSASGLVRFLVTPEPRVEVSVQPVDAEALAALTVALHTALGSELVAAGRGAGGDGDEDALLSALQAWADQPDPPPPSDADDARRALHDLVLGGLHVPDGPLALVPYRDLALVPYPALVRPDGAPLVQTSALSVLPALSTLAVRPPARSGARRRAVVLGAPDHDPRLDLPALPRAAEEAVAVAGLLAPVLDVGEPLLGHVADEATFRARATGAGLLHLACHAAVGTTPADSALYLTPGPDDDGAVGLADAEDLRLDDALVVLAACQTGLGRATPDGVAGLGQAFRRAGARCVVLSLWRVGDASTAALMADFYRLLVGEPGRAPYDVAAALAEAQRRTRATHPRVAQWGAWLVTGDGGWRLAR